MEIQPEILHKKRGQVVIVEMPELKAAVIRSELGGEGTRRAWRQVRELLQDHPAVSNDEYGLVFIPEWRIIPL
jgi:hypothetical protein